MSKKSCLYFFWGHLGDKLSPETRDTPDGCATYLMPLLNELQKTHDVVCPTKQRDLVDITAFGQSEIFASFEQEIRTETYAKLRFCEPKDLLSATELPEFAIIEWRFAIPGRNCPAGLEYPEDYIVSNQLSWATQDYALDLVYQYQILYYCNKNNIPVFLFDLDHKLSHIDELRISQAYPRLRCKILETSVIPTKQIFERVGVNIPFWTHVSCLPSNEDKSYDLVYIGNDYERRESIDKYIKPLTDMRVSFNGNWTKQDRVRYNMMGWSHIAMSPRVGLADFHNVYSNGYVCPMLAKQSYYESGFVTARVYESLYFGSLPIGFAEHVGLSDWLTTWLCKNAGELGHTVNAIKKLTHADYEQTRTEALEHMKPMYDPFLFVASIIDRL